MHPTLFPAILLLALLFSSCLPDEQTIASPNGDGFSNPESLTFSEAEMDILLDELNINRDIHVLTTRLPDHFRRSHGSEFTNQSFSDARKALLGRVLFYDTRLSATKETSCASCHLQEAAFSDIVALSEGINGQVTKRNSIALGSVPTFAPAISGYGSSGDGNTAAVEGDVKFFWDERASTIKEQSLATIEDEREMGKDIHELSDELKNIRMYQILSHKAFGTADLTPDRITLALEKFTSSITSLNTRFDEMINLQQFGRLEENFEFTESEKRGLRLFNDNCASCHGHKMAKPNLAVANNGIDAASPVDKGVGAITGNNFQDGHFKVPFLRNVALTAPYMHDGRFATLEEVIDHYSEGIQNHPTLSPLLLDRGRPVRMNFSAEDKQALLDFLRTTTDETVATNPAWADPFRE